jgi:hypothetical protein
MVRILYMGLKELALDIGDRSEWPIIDSEPSNLILDLRSCQAQCLKPSNLENPAIFRVELAIFSIPGFVRLC